jgi:hypothetical protein
MEEVDVQEERTVVVRIPKEEALQLTKEEIEKYVQWIDLFADKDLCVGVTCEVKMVLRIDEACSQVLRHIKELYFAGQYMLVTQDEGRWV